MVDSQLELSQVLQSTTYDIATENQQGEMTYYFYGKGLLAQDNQEGYLTYHFNNVGSTMAVTDAKGRVSETYNYTPYGELIDGTYSDDIPFLYNGQYGVTTDGNGLYYMRARYYNVDVKRFINQDVLTGTLERISSLNRYAYVEGNPVSYLDPFGLAIELLELLVDAASIVAACTLALSLITPAAYILAGTVLLFIKTTLDLIQLIRYEDEEHLDNLLKDYVEGALNVLIPITQFSEILEISKFGKIANSNSVSIIQIIQSIRGLYDEADKI